MEIEIEKEYLEFLSILLENRLITKENVEDAKKLAEIYKCFKERVGKAKEEIYSEIASYIAEKIIENFIQKKAAGFLDEFLMEKLKRIPSLKLSSLGGKRAADIVADRLFLIGFLGLTDDSFITTGYFKSKKEDPFIPSNLSMAVFNLGNLWDDESLRGLVLNKIAEMYGLPRPKLMFKSLESPEIEEKFDSHLKYIVFRIKWVYKETFENLQDSLVFYNRSLALYTKESGSMNIFSTSSGIVIPEEYRGDITAKKNPYRKKYFDKGIASQSALDLPKFYQWDSETTPKNLYKGFVQAADRDAYKNEAVQILSRFLMLPNLEITEAPFREDPWKIYFTLVSDKSIVFSERGEMRKINHGYLIDEEILKHNQDVYSEIASLLWKREDGIIGSIKKVYKRSALRTYKDLNQICTSEKEAKEMARDIVELLIEDGKKLVEKETKIKAEEVIIEKKKPEAPYARMWTNATVNEEEGDPVSMEEYAKIVSSPKKFNLLIVERKGAKHIYINGIPHKRKIRPLAYKMLKYLLKVKGLGGNALEVWINVWKPTESAVKYVKEKIEEECKKGEGLTSIKAYNELYQKVRKYAHELKEYFKNTKLDFVVKFESHALKIEKLPSYCLLEL